MNDDYVQHMFQEQLARDHYHGKLARAVPWAMIVIGVLSLAAYALREYWFAYVSPYFYQ